MAYRVRNRNRVLRITVCVVAGMIGLGTGSLWAQPYGQTAGDLVNQFSALRPAWFAAAAGAANRLFGLLALIEFAWTAVILVLDKSDLQGWTAALIRRMMFVGAFLALLVNGPTWIPAIIDSFSTLGRNAAGIPTGLSPGDVFVRGLNVAASLLTSSSNAGFFLNPASALALVLAALITFLSFVIVSVHFIMALVESYIVVGAGFIFLGFGGSRWTAPYVERYIALAVAVGVKLMVLYLLVGAGMTLSAGWAARGTAAATVAFPIMEALDLMGGAIIFGILCWQAPKFTASLLGGSPAFSGGDVVAVGFAGAQAGIAVATVGAGAVKLLAARGAATAGAMTVNQAASVGAGGAGGAGMAGRSSVSSAASGGQAGGAAGTGGGPSGGNGSGGKGSGGSGGGGSQGGVGFGGGSNQPKPPTLGGSGGAPASAPGSSASGSRGSSGDPAGSRQATASTGPSQSATPVAESRAIAAPSTPSPTSAQSSSTGSVRGGGLAIATPVESKQSSAPRPVPASPSQSTTAETVSPAVDVGTGSIGAIDLVGSVTASGGRMIPPAVSGAAGDAALPAATDATLDSPQTITSPMAVATGQGQPGPPPSNAIPASLGSRPSRQPAPPPFPSENATLENPQTISSPQTVTAPMTNTSPMTVGTGQPQPPTARPGLEKLASAANITEQALDRSGRFTQGIRQSLPHDGSGGGGPAQLNLHGDE